MHTTKQAGSHTQSIRDRNSELSDLLLASLPYHHRSLTDLWTQTPAAAYPLSILALWSQYRKGCKSRRWFKRFMQVLVLLGMPVWCSIQHGHVLRGPCAAWSLIVATSRTSGEWLWVMRWRMSALCLV